MYLYTHTGNIDEKNYEKGQNYDPRYNTGTIPGKPEFIGDHRDGAYWDDINKSANWTIAYNSVLRNFMKSHNSDLSLDWYRFSMEAIEYYNTVKRKKDVRVNNNTLSTYTNNTNSATNINTDTSGAGDSKPTHSHTDTHSTADTTTHTNTTGTNIVSHSTRPIISAHTADTHTTTATTTATTTDTHSATDTSDTTETDLSTHIDSLHYCNEGVPRLSSVLLQLVIQNDLYKY